MCGFLVVASTEPGVPLPQSDAELVRMRDVLLHRGPDSAGMWVAEDRGVALTHRRLEVIDLEGGAQPMTGSDSGVRLVYNGEIYNYRELREQLRAKGRRFRTESDTEVLLAAYETWGAAGVTRLNGIFSFVLWDPRSRQLFAARDPLGVKPLYYGWWDGRFYAASEAKAIVSDPRVPRSVNPAALDLFFHEGYIPAPSTIWDGMKKLPAGHHLTVPLMPTDSGTPEPHRYYDPPFARVEAMDVGEAEVLERLEHTLSRAVKRQMVSDVALGAFLSGGIDSSLLVGYLAEHASGPLETFSISFENDPGDEAPWAEAVSRHYGTRHNRIVMGSGGVQRLERMAWMHDEPFGDPATVPTSVLSEAAKGTVTVALSGDGGDETHAGYPRYRRMRQMAVMDHVPLAVRKALFGIPARIASSYRRRGALEQLQRDAVDRYDAMTRQMPPHHRRAVYAAGLVRALAGLDGGLADRARPGRRAAFPSGHGDMLDRVQRLDLLTYLPEQLLQKVDRASMSAGLEARVPYLDLDAVDLAARVDPSLRMADGRPKYLLRRLLAARLGADFVERPKQGFTVPAGRWIAAIPAADLEAALFTPGVEHWIDPDRVRSHVLRSPRGRGFLWPLLAFAYWVRAYEPLPPPWS